MDNSFNCVICLKELNIKDGVLTPCKHRYHSECFFKWIYKKEHVHYVEQNYCTIRR